MLQGGSAQICHFAPASRLAALQHDLRCLCNIGPKNWLYAIDAPQMPGASRPGRECAPGDFASRDHLRAPTAEKVVECRQIDLAIMDAK